jgi:hypothetical protein
MSRRTRSFLLWPPVLSHPDLGSGAITGLATGLANNEMQTGLPNCIIPSLCLDNRVVPTDDGTVLVAGGTS